MAVIIEETGEGVDVVAEAQAQYDRAKRLQRQNRLAAKTGNTAAKARLRQLNVLTQEALRHLGAMQHQAAVDANAK